MSTNSPFPSSGGGAVRDGIATAYRLLSRPAAHVAQHRGSRGRMLLRRLLTIPGLLIVFWIYVLYHGERTAFTKAIRDCQWENWEAWPPEARPHRVVFVADPQLVDPHTYPGRPWPLSTLTIKYADYYLSKNFRRIRWDLVPNSVIFLGDLFDGGREWSTTKSQSPEEQYRKYKSLYWLEEYDRFAKIFFDPTAPPAPSKRAGDPYKILASLPGNHDLGFGAGIQMPVRDRFIAYFGESNRIDILGNHTFVSLDSVSLSARDDEVADQLKNIWDPPMQFLESAKDTIKDEILRHAAFRFNGSTPARRFRHEVLDGKNMSSSTPVDEPLLAWEGSLYPSVLLSHVPLYRPRGTPCGPLREKWPPTPPPKGQTEPLANDERNAIAVQAGYQYQNVLTHETSKLIAASIGTLKYAFSGDDHDYCEVVHRGYQSSGSGIREITVKSLSMAMGVRHPGFVMASLWNPVDETGASLSDGKDSALPQTMQTHLCLIPDQLGIFIRYGTYVVLTILLLIASAARSAFYPSMSESSGDGPVLPISNTSSSAENEKAELSQMRNYRFPGADDTSSSQISTMGDKGLLSSRTPTSRTRTSSPMGGYGLPPSQRTYTPPPMNNGTSNSFDAPKSQYSIVDRRPSPRRRRGWGTFWHKLRMGVLKVCVVLVWYIYLLRTS